MPYIIFILGMKIHVWEFQIGVQKTKLVHQRCKGSKATSTPGHVYINNYFILKTILSTNLIKRWNL
jgi:hypothetical protein